MRMRNMFVCAVAGLLVSGSMVFAQQAGQDQVTPERQQQMQAQPGQHAPGQMEAQHGKLILNKANEVIGKNVVDPKGEKLGEIKELAIDGKTGQVAYAVLEFAQTGRDKLFAVPWTALKPKQEQAGRAEAGKTEGTWFTRGEKGAQEFVLDVPKEKLAQAPGFNKDKWPDMANPEWGTEVHRFYNQKPYWETQQGAHTERQPEAGARVDVNRGQANVEAQAGRERTGAGQEQPGHMAQGEHGQRMILKAHEQLLGQDLYNQQGDDIGELNNLLIDRRSGKIAFVVVKIEKGVEGDKDMAALPWNQVKWQWNEQTKEGKIVLKPNVDQFKGQMFAEKDWPDLSNRQVAMNIYREFNTRPYWEPPEQGVLGFQE